MRAELLVLLLPALAHAAPPRFTVADAIRAEWARQAIIIDDKTRAALPAEDRARLDRAERRIGRPGAPPLLPPELEHPDLPTWGAKAKQARTPEERFTALHFLNRLESDHALAALDGLTAADAKGWPARLHLDAHLATSRLRGERLTPSLKAFLDELSRLGKVDRVREKAARLRLVLAGREAALLPPESPTPDAVLAMLDAWNKAPWEVRRADHVRLMKRFGVDGPANVDLGDAKGSWARLGLAPIPRYGSLLDLRAGLLARLFDGLPAMPLIDEIRDELDRIVAGRTKEERLVVQAARAAWKRLGGAPLVEPRKKAPADVIERAEFIEEMKEAPANLDELIKQAQGDIDPDALQALIAGFDRWKLPVEKRRALLQPFLAHRTWIGRYEAYRALSAIDEEKAWPNTPWPAAPPPTPVEKAILDEAIRLAEAARPVRLRITFSAKRTIVLKLDPTVAPINVANLKLLAERHFFDGHRVPRVVPGFVVQMGSPLDTMDGGPGYAVRCEDSLDWYGPGSVGMALSGKDTGGSQFFITLDATPHLTGRYTRVGAVEDPDYALAILDALELGARIEKIEALP